VLNNGKRKMKKIEFVHILTQEEEINLKRLIGKSLCSIGSNSISIEPNKPEIWKFYKWIELSNWDDNDTIRLNFSYDETYCLDEFVELRIECSEKERKALNAHISFSGENMFNIEKIETYGYDSEYKTKNQCKNLPEIGLNENEEYTEVVQSENIILLYGAKGKKILVECEFPYLELRVTMNEDEIKKRLDLEEFEFNAKMKLKRTIKY
jgi:hypothetical protein